MPQRKQRAALYVRESDIALAMDSTTVESAVQALLDHAKKEGYEVDPLHIFKEAISGYSVYYFDRKELMRMLKLAEQNAFDVLLVTEIRALSRRGAGEVLVIYNSLQKASVRLETLNERITDDPMGEVLLSFRASWARIERDQSFLRMARGKKSRIEIGNAPPNGRRCYGYLLVDTEKETKGRYVYNTAIVYEDSEGIEWSEIKVRTYILENILLGKTLHGIAIQLNKRGIPPPREPKKGIPCWEASTVRRIAENPINMGEVWVNQRTRVGKKMVNRPKEEWILLSGIAPALVDKETYEKIMKQISYNKEESLRNNKHPEALGLVRAGYIFCGVCGRRMSVKYASQDKSGIKPLYRCYKKEGSEDILHNHRTAIRVQSMDSAVREHIQEALRHPERVREQVEELRKQNRPVVDETEIEDTIEKIIQKIKNLMKLAEDAPDDEELERYRTRVQELGREKREAEKLRYVLADDAQEREVVEHQLQKFEQWVTEVQSLTDPAYMQTAPYDEVRMAVRILGIRVTVYPTLGNWPFRHNIVAKVPEVLAIVGQSTPVALQSFAFFHWTEY